MPSRSRWSLVTAHAPGPASRSRWSANPAAEPSTGSDRGRSRRPTSNQMPELPERNPASGSVASRSVTARRDEPGCNSQVPGLAGAGSRGRLALLLACLLAFPRLLHPPLSPAELQGVTEPRTSGSSCSNARQSCKTTFAPPCCKGSPGVLLVVGAVATWRQLQISREGQITERFSRAVDQLGSDKQDVRLGGIYTLERIAADSPADRTHCPGHVLARMSAPTPPGWSARQRGRCIRPQPSTSSCPGCSTAPPTSRRP